TAVVGVLSLAVFMSSLDLFIVNLAFPYISKDYPGTSLSSLSWVLNAYTIVFAAVLVPAGRWADRIGRRRLFSGGLVLFSAGSVFGINVPVGLVAVWLAARVVPESKDPGSLVRPDIIGAGLLAAAVGLVALALVKAPAWGWGSASFLGLLAASVVCGAAMVYR